MKNFIYVTVLCAVLPFFGCGGSSTPTDDSGDDVEPCINCGLTFKALFAQNYPNQIHTDYRSYLSAGSKISRGILYARFCSDAACETELTREIIEEDVLLSTGLEQDFTLTSAPLGASFLQLGLFTDYASEHSGEAFGQFTVLQTDATTVGANNSDIGDQTSNPDPSTLEINISNGSNEDLGTIRLGSIVFDEPAVPAVGENPKKIWVAVGDENARTRLSIIDEGDDEATEELDPPTLEGDEFSGDLCGTVATDDTVYTVGIGLNGAYVFEYDSETRTQRHEHAAFVRHQDSECDVDDLACSIEPPSTTLDADTFPRPCTGVVVDQDSRRLLYLTRDANDNSDSTSDRLVGIDVTNLSENHVETIETGSEINDAFAIRNIALNSESLYLTAAGWANDDLNTRVLKYDIPAEEDAVEDLPATTFATVEQISPDCGCAEHYTPGTIVATFDGARRLFVGNEDSISVINSADGDEIGQIDITNYGQVITDFALSPDGETLYAVPACESTVTGTLSSATQNQATDHQQVVVLDLTNDADDDGMPDILYGDRDFDGDEIADGGIDMKFHNVKRNILAWCETCFGVLPPTTICMPKISAGENYLYLRGNSGTQAYGQSGLGQMGDIAAFDLSTGEGVLFRNYIPWLDGPSGRWGIPLDEAAQATGGMIVP